MKEEFNEAGRVEEQREIGNLKFNRLRENLLREIRDRTERFLSRKDEEIQKFKDKYREKFDARYTELLKEQGLRHDFMPPGIENDLKARAKADIENTHQGELNKLKTGYENKVREHTDKTVRVDKLEKRAEQYQSDRDSWVETRGNIVDYVSQSQSPAEKQRYEGMLQCVDNNWASTVEQNYDTSRDRGPTPELGRVAYDVGGRER